MSKSKVSVGFAAGPMTCQKERATQILDQLLHLTQSFNLIHETLRPEISLDDLYEQLVPLLVSRKAMGFSKAVVLRWDPEERRFLGLTGFGAANPRLHQQLQDRICRDDPPEIDFSHLESPPKATDADEIEDRDVAEGDRILNYWRDVARQLETENVLAETMGRLAVLWKGKTGEFISEVFKTAGALSADRARLIQAELPEALLGIFEGGSLWAGIRGKRRPRLLLAVDKSFENDAIGAIDRHHLGWFCSQVSLAIKNAELFVDLKRTNEALQEIDTLKSNFLATVSHELRTPLTAITGFARLLIGNKIGTLSQSQTQILQRVLTHGERLSNVINDLIEIAEIDAGSALVTELQPIDPLEALMETLPRLEPRRAPKSISIEPIVTGPTPKILSDRKALVRIFYHLLDNAVKFSHEESRVTVEFDDQEDKVAIRITDRGIGIAPERLRLIFEAFYQVDSHLTRIYEGMGIGLTLTKKLVDRTGGRILAQSELGHGSTFTVYYPKA
jgi:signal transduction histidine kinase